MRRVLRALQRSASAGGLMTRIARLFHVKRPYGALSTSDRRMVPGGLALPSAALNILSSAQDEPPSALPPRLRLTGLAILGSFGGGLCLLSVGGRFLPDRDALLCRGLSA